MMATDTRPRRRLGPWIAAGAAAAVAGLVVTLAVVWPGYDAQQTPLEDASVWALQSGDGRRYARVNTELRELDTVKQVENPSGIVQSADRVLVYTDGDARFADVPLARPVDLDADAADAFQQTPSGTASVSSEGDWVAYLTESGDVQAGPIASAGATRPVDPYADVQVDDGEERPRLRATAASVSRNGLVHAVSPTNDLVVTARASTGEIVGEDTVALPDDGVLQVTSVGDRWVVYDADGSQIWLRGRDEPIAVDAAPGALLQRASAASPAVHLADAAGLVAVALDGSGSERIAEQTGAPAVPTEVAGVLQAAWLGPQTGALWSATDGVRPLPYGTEALGDEVEPAFAVNGTRAILNETVSGWVWTIPDGQLVASSQRWDADDQTQRQQDQQLEAERVIAPKPPVAVADAFGVRAGRDAVLPVLLNDHDPNEDVLSVVASSVTPIDPSFGTVRVTNEHQQLVVSVSPTARGSTTLSYQITDGTSADGLLSQPATVTLAVAPDDVNTAPVWCGVDGCLATWPTPEVAPGGTTSVDALEGWVDPEGDPIYLAEAVNQSGLGTVAREPSGTVTYQHPDPNSTDASSIPLGLTVSDARGATAEKTLTVAVVPSPALTADAFTVTGVAGTPLTVDVGAHVRGGNGAVSLAAAKALDSGAGNVVANPAALSFVFESDRPGSSVVQYTVRDQGSEVSAIARVVLLDPTTAQISTPPLTAFVRPSEDTSVDVLSAVNNPAGLVLLASDLRLESQGTASLTADTVGQNLIRVSGATEDGTPGTLGVVRYTVSDGTGSVTGTTTGELTVILLPAASAEPPIAVDDAVTVRAGAQIDIPVLANDTAPAGGLIAVDPSTVVNDSSAGLAFATPRLVRYLAPDAPGTYSLGYTVYRLGFPEMTDTARIFVTVVSDDTNAAPVPRDLVGRALSGSSVTIPFDALAIDPDGDSVSLDRLLSQPRQGSASVSAEGDALIYTSTPGSSGQDSFTYQVRDSRGAVGSATVRVGILDAQTPARPVTYSDYAQSQAGESNEVIVRPADNDVDPAGHELELIEVRPYAPPGTAEYTALEGMLADVDLEAGTVRLAVGTELGTYAFGYTVRSRTGDTAQGLVVLKVVRNPVPDFPVVADTVLTAETRDQLASGVDVLDGKVTWAGGDAAGLSLSLWEESADLRVDGSRIVGEAPPEGRLVPFRVSGTSFAGTEVVSYGFLRIPGESQVPLSLRASFAQMEVPEKGSVDVDMAQAVAVPRDGVLEVLPEGLRASGSRPEARCALVAGTTVRYDAGAGSPWADVCTVPVRLAGHDAVTVLAIRVVVIAEAPQPELRAAAMSVSPGETREYDLTRMTTWQGQNDLGALQYATAYRGDQFEVVQQGPRLVITAKDAARPGREEPVVVRLASHPESAASTLGVTVGPAPSSLPKGGTATQQCSQAGGDTSCTIPVIGVGGEVNPLPGTPLVLVSVTNPTNCRGVSFARASDSAVTATWSRDAAGAADCTGSFVVRDAQQRTSNGDRTGTVILDLQGLPADPQRMVWTSYSGDSVTLRVVSEERSHPAVSGYVVTGGDREVRCSAAGECPAIPATNGKPVTYEAVAVNSVGDSRSSVSIEAWAYERPKAPAAISATPVPNAGNDGKTADVTIRGIDPSTGRLRLESERGASRTVDVGGQSSVTIPRFDVGANQDTTLTATPLTRFTVPPESIVAGGSSEGRTARGTASGIGIPAVTLTVKNGAVDRYRGSVELTGTVSQGNGTSGRLFLGFSATREGCEPTIAAGGSTGRAEATIDDVRLYEARTYFACAEYRFDGARFGVGRDSEEHRLTGPIPAPDVDRATYSVTLTGGSWSSTRGTQLDSRPRAATDFGFEVRYFSANAGNSTSFDSLFEVGTDPGAIQAKSCLIGDSSTCSDGAVGIAPESGSAAYLTRVVFGDCTSSGAVPEPDVSASSRDYTASVDQEANTATVTFANRLAGLAALVKTYPRCDPAPDPDPDEDSDGEPTLPGVPSP